MNRHLTPDELNKMVNHLAGSTGSLDEYINDEFSEDEGVCSLDRESTDYIDEHMFCCENCGWWCLADEMSIYDDGVCDDCVDDVEDKRNEE